MKFYTNARKTEIVIEKEGKFAAFNATVFFAFKNEIIHQIPINELRTVSSLKELAEAFYECDSDGKRIE